jgi:ethanolamine ammonia-lyase small subunit
LRSDLTKPLPTTARLSLGRTAPSISTHDQLQFQLDHALARDAVHAQLDIPALVPSLQARNLKPLILKSAVDPHPTDRRAYLRRPDLGRKLHPDSISELQSLYPTANPVILSEAAEAPQEKRSVILSGGAGPYPAPKSKDPDEARSASIPQTDSANPRILFLLADGLSAQALEHHALPLLDTPLPLIPCHLSLIPVVQNARVAIADQVGALLHADLTILFIGERPGLSSPDSLGVYLTWNPRPGRTDAERNCISNIRGDHGLSYAEAAHRIAHYVAEATRLQTTGIALKDPGQTLKLDAQ